MLFNVINNGAKREKITKKVHFLLLNLPSKIEAHHDMRLMPFPGNVIFSHFVNSRVHIFYLVIKASFPLP